MEHTLIAPPGQGVRLSPMDPRDDGRPLQDRLPGHCFGCGTLNAHGLQIKSHRDGDDYACVWQPRPEHIGYPGYVYGGTIASVVDCHAVWTTLAVRCRAIGHDLQSGPPPFVVVTGSLRVNYLKPARIDRPLALRARLVEHGERKSVVACSVRQDGIECAAAEVVTVRVQEMR